MPIKRIAAICLSVLILAGCSGIGDGNEPETLKLLPLSSISGLTRDDLDDLIDRPTEALEAFTCLSNAATAIVRFTDGDVSIFSNRVVWASDDLAVVTVSNGDDPVPGSGGLFFAPGTLKPIGPGTANVTAEYLGLTATIPVTVSELDVSTIVVNPSKAVMAPRSRQSFRVEAMVDGVLTSVSQAVTFRFAPQCSDDKDNDGDGLIDFPDDKDCTAADDTDEADRPQCSDDKDNDGDGLIDFPDDVGCTAANANDEDPVAILGGDGQGNAEVAAVSVGDPPVPLTLEANFIAPCPRNPTVPIQVAPLSSLKLEYEEGEGFADGQLIAGSTQFLRVTGIFGNVDVDDDGVPETQDLSGQSVLTSTMPTFIGTGGFFDGPNRVTGGAGTAPPPAAVGSAKVSANFGRIPDPDAEGPEVEVPGTKSNSLDFNSLNVVVDTLAIRPAGPITIAPRARTSLKAFGTYTFPVPGGTPREIDLTRHVAWAVTKVDGKPVEEDDVPILFIQSGINTAAGAALSRVSPDAAEQENTVTITATYVRGVIDSTVPLPAGDLEDLVRTTTINVRVGAPSEPEGSAP